MGVLAAGGEDEARQMAPGAVDGAIYFAASTKLGLIATL